MLAEMLDLVENVAEIAKIIPHWGRSLANDKCGLRRLMSMPKICDKKSP